MPDQSPTILTVTLNSAVDRVILLDELVLDRPNTARKLTYSVGGKGLDTSVVLRHLGVNTVGLAFLAGKKGRLLSRLVRSYGIRLKAVWVEGETRGMDVIAETRNGRVTHIREGDMIIREGDVRRFVRTYLTSLKSCSWVVMSGSIPASLPSSIYCELVQLASQAGVPSLVDSSQAAVLDALTPPPSILKLNRREFIETFNLQAGDFQGLLSQAQQVREQYSIPNLVITCAEEGILAITEAGHFHALAPWQKAVNPAGAGDAVSAGIVWRLSLGEGWENALRWAAATAAAVLLTEGTADCHMEDIRHIFPDTIVQRL